MSSLYLGALSFYRLFRDFVIISEFSSLNSFKLLCRILRLLHLCTGMFVLPASAKELSRCVVTAILRRQFDHNRFSFGIVCILSRLYQNAFAVKPYITICPHLNIWFHAFSLNQVSSFFMICSIGQNSPLLLRDMHTEMVHFEYFFSMYNTVILSPSFAAFMDLTIMASSFSVAAKYFNNTF